MPATLESPSNARYELLVIQNGNVAAEFGGHYGMVLAGSLDGQAWILSPVGGSKPLWLRQHVRLEGVIEHPQQAVVKPSKCARRRARGNLVATQTIKVRGQEAKLVPTDPATGDS